MPLIEGIHIPVRRAITDVDKEKRVKMKVTAMMDQTLIIRKMFFIHTTTMPLMKRTKMRRIELLKIGNGNLSQIIWKFLIYHIIMVGLMGLRQAWRNICYHP